MNASNICSSMSSAGIAGYGNCIGIPTVGGEVMFDESYEGNPLVNAMCVGLIDHDKIQRGVAKGVGNPVFYVGPATGRDGIHGATFASEELTEESEAKRTAVQVGDPFMEKLVMEAMSGTDRFRHRARHSGYGRGRPDLLQRGDGEQSRQRHGAVPGRSAAARRRHDALRDDAVGIAGADAVRRGAEA